MNIIKRKDDSDGQLLQPVSLRQAMNRLFDESIWSPFSILEGGLGNACGAWFPKVDISESDKEYTIKANVPDIEPDKIDIELTEDSISISGRIEKVDSDKSEHFHRVEREYGEFHRSFVFAEKVDPDTVKAKTKNGVLTIIVKKVEGKGKKKVEIEKE